MSEHRPILEVRDLQIHYGAIEALKGVSLQVQEGEIVTLIGSNGAGKSTLLKAISGMLKPTRGQILFRGIPLPQLDPRAALVAGISHVPEGRGIFGNLTVWENLQLGAYLRKDSKEISKDLDHVLSLFPILKERISQKAGTLSGGEQQMLAIGRGLMAKPKVMLLDEPSLGLAPLLVRKIFEIIREINKEGCTVFLVEQNARLALKSAHRGYVLETGQIVLENEAATLLADDSVRKAYLGE
jgi:branched-chain amino acid transport system ATP-binding protein